MPWKECSGKNAVKKDAIFFQERTEFLSKMKKHNVTRWQYPDYVHVPLSDLGVVCKSLRPFTEPAIGKLLLMINSSFEWAAIFPTRNWNSTRVQSKWNFCWYQSCYWTQMRSWISQRKICRIINQCKKTSNKWTIRKQTTSKSRPQTTVLLRPSGEDHW